MPSEKFRNAKTPVASYTVPLLDLPTELFQSIIHKIVGSITLVKAMKHRRVCKAFDRQIRDDLSERASRTTLSHLFKNPSCNKLFELYGGSITSKKVLRQNSRKHLVIEFIEPIVSHVLDRRQELDALQCESFRFQCTRTICECLMAVEQGILREYFLQHRKISNTVLLGSFIDQMPAVAAALGDSKMLQKHVTSHFDLLRNKFELFPNALDAAVASGKTQALSSILRYLKHHVKGKPLAPTWKEMRTAARGIGHALRTAIRLHRTQAGMMIFGFLAVNDDYRSSIGFSFEDNLVKDCMRYGNVDLMYGAFVYQQQGRYDPADNERMALSPMSQDEQKFLLRCGRPGALRSLIKHGLFNPNECSPPISPLQLALGQSDYKTARKILEHTSIDAVASSETGRSALWLAAQAGHTMLVKLLLEAGANPEHSNGTGSALGIAKFEHHNECTFLLTKVKQHGKEYLKRPDLWDIHNKETALRHLYDNQYRDIHE